MRFDCYTLGAKNSNPANEIKEVIVTYKEKLGYLAVGGLLVFVGMFAANLSPLTAQRDTFGDITCTGLRVVDANGRTMVWLSRGDYDKDSPFVKVKDKDGNWAQIMVGGGVASIQSKHKDGNVANMLATRNVAQVQSINKSGSRVQVLAMNKRTSDVAGVMVNCKSGHKTAMIADYDGASVGHYHKNGHEAAISVDDSGAGVMLRNKDRNHEIVTSASNSSAFVEVRDREGNRATIKAGDSGGFKDYASRMEGASVEVVHNEDDGTERYASIRAHRNGGLVIGGTSVLGDKVYSSDGKIRKSR